MSDRCPSCDAPLARDADVAARAAGDVADNDVLCWSLGGRCVRESVDWRARALAAEAKLMGLASVDLEPHRLTDAELDDALEHMRAMLSVRGTAIVSELRERRVEVKRLRGEPESLKLAIARHLARYTGLDEKAPIGGLLGAVGDMRDRLAHANRCLEACADSVAALLSDVAALEARRDELLALVARISQETPLPDEIRGWEGQRAKLVAEVGTLRSEARRLEAERNEARSDVAWLDHENSVLVEQWHDAARTAEWALDNGAWMQRNGNRALGGLYRRLAIVADAADMLSDERDTLRLVAEERKARVSQLVADRKKWIALCESLTTERDAARARAQVYRDAFMIEIGREPKAIEWDGQGLTGAVTKEDV